MQKCEQLYEGKAKKVFLTDDPYVLIVSYKDRSIKACDCKRDRDHRKICRGYMSEGGGNHSSGSYIPLCRG